MSIAAELEKSRNEIESLGVAVTSAAESIEALKVEINSHVAANAALVEQIEQIKAGFEVEKAELVKTIEVINGDLAKAKSTLTLEPFVHISSGASVVVESGVAPEKAESPLAQLKKMKSGSAEYLAFYREHKAAIDAEFSHK